MLLTRKVFSRWHKKKKNEEKKKYQRHVSVIKYWCSCKRLRACHCSTRHIPRLVIRRMTYSKYVQHSLSISFFLSLPRSCNLIHSRNTVSSFIIISVSAQLNAWCTSGIMIWHSCQLNVLHFLFRHVGWSVGRSVGCRARAAGCNVRAHVATTRATQHMHPSRALFRVASKVPGIRSTRYVEFRRIFATARQRTLSQLERDGVADGRLPNPVEKCYWNPQTRGKKLYTW